MTKQTYKRSEEWIARNKERSKKRSKTTLKLLKLLKQDHPALYEELHNEASK